MSLAYADALTWREDLGGQLGDPEVVEERASAMAKADLLASVMLSSTTAPSSSPSSSGRGVVVFTGAGISVSSGIPDFRGPNGVWTRQRNGLPAPALARGVSFATARPSLTHLALAHLARAGLVARVVSQNVDGLHLRSGVPREKLFELHGNCFVEACRGCGARHERDFETGTVGFKATGRRCDRCLGGGEGGKGAKRGSGRLYDTVLDWESPLPAAELAQAERDAAAAAVSLCLGTSLQISPANSIPERTVTRKGGGGGEEEEEPGGGEEGGGGGGGAAAAAAVSEPRPPPPPPPPLAPGNLTIVNLQGTPKDRLATSVIRARADDVMARVLARVLGAAERLPAWERRDGARVRYEVTRVVGRREKKKKEEGAAGKRRRGADSAAEDADAGSSKRSSNSNSCSSSSSTRCWGVELAVWVESTHGAERCPLPMVSGVGVAAAAAAAAAAAVTVPRGSSSGAAAAAAAAESDRILAAAKRRAAREALEAAAEADGEDVGAGEAGGGGGEEDDGGGDDLGRLSSASLPGPSAPYSARLQLDVGEQENQRGLVVVVAAVALGLGLGADESRRRAAVDAAAFAIEVEVVEGSGGAGAGPKKTPPPQLLQSGSFDVSFVSQVVDYGERVEEARREIEEEERVKREGEETKK